MLDTKKFIEEVKKIGLSSEYKTRSAIERKIKSLEPSERQQIKRFWQGFKMPPSQIREVLKSLKEEGVLKTTPYSILKKAEQNIRQAEKKGEEERKKETLKKTAALYRAQDLAKDNAAKGLSPRATVEEIMKKGDEDKRVYNALEQARKGPAPLPENKKDENQTPPPMLKEMMI